MREVRPCGRKDVQFLFFEKQFCCAAVTRSSISVKKRFMIDSRKWLPELYNMTHHCYPAKDIFINMPDSLSELMRQAYLYHPTVHDISELAKDANNIDSLYRLVLMNSDIESYNKLRRLCERDTMFMASLETANRTHYPVACYDVYRYLIRNYRVSDETFQFAYKYLCMAADSMYYPAVLLKASLCLTGAYFPQDTILGKELLEQCQINTPIPFWQQYSKPPIYKHLLSRYTDNTRINVKQEP
jgi:hypothetical protein